MIRWQSRANCKGKGHWMFFSVKHKAEAKAICAGCTVRKQCLEFAIKEVDFGQSDKLVLGLGVWGGLDGSERVQLRKRVKKNG